MKNKVYILNLGTMSADQNALIYFSVFGNKDQHVVSSKWVTFPILGFLIETEKNGYILFDTGANPRCSEDGYWSRGQAFSSPATVSEHQRIENQLALCGVKPEDIQTVVLSHMHDDHMGNIAQFTHADVYVPKADFINAHITVHSNPDQDTYGAYVRGEVETLVKRYHLVDEDFELAPGVRVINLPGHTQGLLGVVVEGEEGTYIMPADCMYSIESYGPPAQLSGVFVDSVAFLNSIEKVRKIMTNTTNGQIFLSHDPEIYRKAKKAPEFYC